MLDLGWRGVTNQPAFNIYILLLFSFFPALIVAGYRAETSYLALKAGGFQIFVRYTSVLIVLSSYVLHPADIVGLFVTEKAGLAAIARNRCNWEFATHTYSDTHDVITLICCGR
jgi:hypothetical protein